MTTFRSLLILSLASVLALAASPARAAKAGSDKGPLVVWNGEELGTRASGWASPEKNNSPEVWASIEPVEGTGYKSKTALVWTAKGKDWKGFGWNWWSWWPSDGGTDITPYKYFFFWIRFEMEEEAKGPALDNLTFKLSCSYDGGKGTADLLVVNYLDKDPFDGEWHQVVVPLKDILDAEESREFDPHTVWEFDMGQWTLHEQDFKAYIDNIGFK